MGTLPARGKNGGSTMVLPIVASVGLRMPVNAMAWHQGGTSIHAVLQRWLSILVDDSGPMAHATFHDEDLETY